MSTGSIPAITNNQVAKNLATDKSNFTKASEVNSSFQELPISPETGVKPELAEKNREVMEEMSNYDTPEQEKALENKKTNKQKDKYQLQENDPLGNMVKRFRNTFHQAGNSIMWSTAGVGGLLYLGLGWEIGAAIAAVGLGVGYLLKNKIANAGLDKNPHKEIIKQIKDSEFPKEYKFAMLKMVEDAYQKQNQGDFKAGNVKALLDNTFNKARDYVSNLSQAPQEEPEVNPS